MRLFTKRRCAIVLVLIPLVVLATLVGPRMIRATRRWDSISKFTVAAGIQLRPTPLGLGDVWLTRANGELIETGSTKGAMTSISFDDYWVVLFYDHPGTPSEFVIIERANGRIAGVNAVPNELLSRDLDRLRRSRLAPEAFMDKYGTP